MIWRRQPRGALRRGKPPWTHDEVELLVRAVARAPSVHNTQPWRLSAQGRQATLEVREPAAVERHDPEHRDLLVSFGAALTNLVLAVRRTGWSADVRVEAEPRAAVVTAARRAPPSATELRRFQAIPRRSSYRRNFADTPLPHLQRETLLHAASAPGVRPLWIIGEDAARELAQHLVQAAGIFRADRLYQRELTAWTFPAGVFDDAGMPVEALAESGLAAMGLVRSTTRIPDPEVLADHIEDESVLLLATDGDDPFDHVHAGEAMEHAWLSATAMGIAASVMTQPLHVGEVREGLRSALQLSGHPQVVMRFGFAEPIPVPRTSRRPPTELG